MLVRPVGECSVRDMCWRVQRAGECSVRDVLESAA